VPTPFKKKSCGKALFEKGGYHKPEGRRGGKKTTTPEYEREICAHLTILSGLTGRKSPQKGKGKAPYDGGEKRGEEAITDFQSKRDIVNRQRIRQLNSKEKRKKSASGKKGAEGKKKKEINPRSTMEPLLPSCAGKKEGRHARQGEF